ncbi:MAG: hypothetical protein LBS50_10955 [Prevotellaceae bacterium]|jgi:predicted permease|nr:hypothetical protein [Prevotellaceae bacterium]
MEKGKIIALIGGITLLGIGTFLIVKKIKSKQTEQLPDDSSSGSGSGSGSGNSGSGTAMVFPIKYGNTSYSSSVYNLQKKLNTRISTMYSSATDATKQNLVSIFGSTHLLSTDGLFGEKTRKAVAMFVPDASGAGTADMGKVVTEAQYNAL